MSELDEIVSSVTASKKYGSLCEDTIRRVAERELEGHGNLKSATKAAKRKLHQVYGAFERNSDYEAAYERLQEAYTANVQAEIRAACREALILHSSTRERLPILDHFFQDIFGITGQPASILDLGCGLNPLAFPWMGLPLSTRYTAIEIDEDRVLFLNRYMQLAGLEPLGRCQDILVQPPEDMADVALLLKMSPTLERQVQGATLHLLEQISASFVVVSFAVRSLGGREKGMLDRYQQQFSDWAAGKHWQVEMCVFDSELVFVVNREP